jgi:uncharacterized circularly permuted ATP-grasp superfamily protein/uncharacterized alpha-E superfamily protein
MATDSAPDPVQLAERVALPPRPGHFDELRERDGALRASWRQFFQHLGPGGLADLDRRADTVARQIRDDGVTYNVYDEESGPQRPWSLDLLPFVISAAEWTQLERGVVQRARLLSRVMRDVYGPQRLLKEGWLPPALVLGNPGYLRPLAGVTPMGGTFLHIVAFDLGRAPDGRWWVVSQRTQAPSGLGYALQNRIIVSRLFPDAFREMRVQRLAASYRRLLDMLTRVAPRTPAAPGIVLLTPGPYNETYFEQAYLARYLGVPLVEGSDLTVRDDQVFLKTLHGLRPVHVILRRLDDDWCDPLELREDSALGVPGLLNAIRAQRVLVANALGSGFLESPALNGFLPAIAQEVLKEELLLPSLPSWWCGERAAFDAVIDSLHEKVIKPTYPNSRQRAGFDVRIGADLSVEARDKLRVRIEADPDAFTVQDYLPLSLAPAWQGRSIVPRVAMVRVFAIADGHGGWQVLPGGLTRIASPLGRIVSMQRGGSSQDTWVQTEGQVDTFSMLPEPLTPADLARRQRPVTSRAAENLFWMGRYAERADFSSRLARQILAVLSDDVASSAGVHEAMGRLAESFGLVPADTPSPGKSAAAFERTLIAALADARGSSVAFNLASLMRSGANIRERLSSEHWRLLTGAASNFAADLSRKDDVAMPADIARGALAELSVRIAAITGAQTDRMTRDDGWRLLSVGRSLERLSSLAEALRVLAETRALADEDGFDLALGLFDSTITYRSLYQRRIEMGPLLDLLVFEQANPRSLARVARVLNRDLEKVPGTGGDLTALVSPAETWPSLVFLCAGAEEGWPHLQALAERLQAGAVQLSNVVGTGYFSHAGERFRVLAV